MSGVPWRYFGWQLRDFVPRRGVPIVLVSLLLGVQLLLPWRLALGPEWLEGPEAADRLAFATQRLLATIPFLAAVLAINGLVADDRRSGHARLLFAKPISAPAFYAQRFAAALAGTLGAALLVAVGYGWLVSAAAAGPLVVLVAVTFVCVGGLGFLLSVLVPLDWIVLVVLWLGAALAQDAAGRAGGAWPLLAGVLPPAGRLAAVEGALATGATPAAADLLWLLAYGSACIALALLALRHRPLAR